MACPGANTCILSSPFECCTGPPTDLSFFLSSFAAYLESGRADSRLSKEAQTPLALLTYFINLLICGPQIIIISSSLISNL